MVFTIGQYFNFEKKNIYRKFPTRAHCKSVTAYMYPHSHIRFEFSVNELVWERHFIRRVHFNARITGKFILPNREVSSAFQTWSWSFFLLKVMNELLLYLILLIHVLCCIFLLLTVHMIYFIYIFLLLLKKFLLLLGQYNLKP